MAQGLFPEREFTSHVREPGFCELLAGCELLLSMNGWMEEDAAMPRSLFWWPFISKFPRHIVALLGSYPNTFLGEDQPFWHPRRMIRGRCHRMCHCVFFMYFEEIIDKGFPCHTLAIRWLKYSRPHVWPKLVVLRGRQHPKAVQREHSKKSLYRQFSR